MGTEEREGERTWASTGYQANDAKAGSTGRLGLVERLPSYLLDFILNRNPDARHRASCNCVNKAFYQSGRRTQSVRFICLYRHYLTVRKAHPIQSHSDEDEDEDEDDGNYEPEYTAFKEVVEDVLGRTECVEQLRIEIEQEMQSHMFQENEKTVIDFWLSEPKFVKNWVPSVQATLQHLCIVDYGPQAIRRPTTVLQILSAHCKRLKTLELRNMFLAKKGNDGIEAVMELMPQMLTLTLRCIKMKDDLLLDISKNMPALQTLALLGVSGLQEVDFNWEHLKVLCIGLSTKSKSITLLLPSLVKLQLKMVSPEKLRVETPSLAHLALGMEKQEEATVEFGGNVKNVRELLFGASHNFSTLSELSKSNPGLEKAFLDVPCMALHEDGRFEGVLKGVPLSLPNMKVLGLSCPSLHTFSVGPGLWHSMECDMENNQELARPHKLPQVERLIIHMIVQRLDSCLSVLQMLINTLPSLRSVEIYVHSDSAGKPDFSSFKEQVPELKLGTWTRSINFTCFSF